MDCGQPGQFGVFLTPSAENAKGLLTLAHAGRVEDPAALRWFASDVIPADREAVAKAR
jgi:hypothetical protein